MVRGVSEGDPDLIWVRWRRNLLENGVTIWPMTKNERAIPPAQGDILPAQADILYSGWHPMQRALP